MAAVAPPPPMPTAGRGQRYAVSMVDQHQPGGPKYFDRSRPPQVSVHCCKHIVCVGRFDCLWIVCVCVCVVVYVHAESTHCRVLPLSPTLGTGLY